MVDLVGQRFERLLVIEELEDRSSDGRRLWRCRCDCGEEKIAHTQHLRRGQVKSCGCLWWDGHASYALKHGHARGSGWTPTYRSWRALVGRCDDATAKYYGAKGVKVCGRWRLFENFLADMGERPEGTTIGRIKADEDYMPGNCKWETPKQQAATRDGR